MSEHQSDYWQSLCTTAYRHLTGHCHGTRPGHGCNTITPEHIQPYCFLTPSKADKSQWLWLMWLDWLFSTSREWQRLSCSPAPVSQTEEQYVSQQGCQTHPSQMLRWNTRDWPKENNTGRKPLLNDPSVWKVIFVFLSGCFVFYLFFTSKDCVQYFVNCLGKMWEENPWNCLAYSRWIG